MSQLWIPTPALKLSLATHVAAGIGLLAGPGYWPWALGAVAFNQAIITGAGMLPRTTLLGPNLNRLPASAIDRDRSSPSSNPGGWIVRSARRRSAGRAPCI